MENKAFHHGSAQEVAQAHQAPRQSDLEDLEGPVFYAKKKQKHIKIEVYYRMVPPSFVSGFINPMNTSSLYLP